jgi:hypothetical protein
MGPMSASEQQGAVGPDAWNRLAALRCGVALHRVLDVAIQLLNLRREQRVVRWRSSQCQ